MSSTSDEKEAVIFRLSDELLVQIFSYITEIPNKMVLEQVSQRFLSVSADPGGWKGIHTLELMIKCTVRDETGEMMINEPLKGHCGQDKLLLNSYCIPFAKWPAAVQLLVDRTQIRQLLIHFGCEDIFVGNESVLSHLMEILKGSDKKKVKIEYLEFHDSESLISDEGQCRSILSDSLQISAPYLKEFVLKVEGDVGVTVEEELSNGATAGLLAPIWPIVKECSYLETFSVRADLFVELSVIIGKPIRKLCLILEVYNHATIDGVVQIINGASGKGVQDLTLMNKRDDESEPYIDLKDFCDKLSEDARKKLKFIKTLDVFQDYSVFSRLPLIPSMLPKLERLETLLAIFPADYEINELCANFVSFVMLTYDDSFSRQIFIHTLGVHDINAFATGLMIACQQADITAQIGESDDFVLAKFGEPEQSVLLTKGNSSIRIIVTAGSLSGALSLCTIL